MNQNKKLLLPLIFFFILLNAVIFVFKTFFKNHGFDVNIIVIANLFFFCLSLAAFFVQRKGLQSDNPNAFIRGVYSSIMLKLFICIIAVTVYAFINKEKINKPAIFFAMGLYIIYTSIEVAALIKVAKGKSNVKKGITS
jgi:FtsH-binding integral membrane protein